MRAEFLSLLISLFIFIPHAHAQFVPTAFKPNVVDSTSTLTLREIEELNLQIQDLQSKGVYAAIYLVPTLSGDSIEEAAEHTFRNWKLGEAGKDNGLLFIFSLQDRRARIEVGYGLEGEIPDVLARGILDDVILPKFKASEYAEGLKAGLRTIAAARDGQDLSHLNRSSGSNEVDWSRSGPVWMWWTLFVWGLPILIRFFKSVPPNSSFLYRLGLEKNGNRILKLILTANPGIFVAVLGPIAYDSITPQMATSFLNESAMPVMHRFFLVGLTVFGLGAAFKIAYFAIGHAKSTLNPDHKRKGSYLLRFLLDLETVELNVGAAIATLLLTITSFAANESADVLFAISFGYFLMNVAFKHLQLRPLLSDADYSRQKAKLRLRRIQSRVVGTRTIFGKSYTHTRSSSSSSSFGSSSSWSSSSGGGRSGGGGASSSW